MLISMFSYSVKQIVTFGKKVKLILLITPGLLCLGCEDFPDPSELNITNIQFRQEYANIILDLEDGVYTSFPANFDVNNPRTWTGNAAQYVKHNYLYDVSYAIKNSGGTRAYETEIDLHLKFDNGDEEIQTIYLDEIRSKRTHTGSISVFSTNKQLVECYGEVFWVE